MRVVSKLRKDFVALHVNYTDVGIPPARGLAPYRAWWDKNPWSRLAYTTFAVLSPDGEYLAGVFSQFPAVLLDGMEADALQSTSYPHPDTFLGFLESAHDLVFHPPPVVEGRPTLEELINLRVALLPPGPLSIDRVSGSHPFDVFALPDPETNLQALDILAADPPMATLYSEGIARALEHKSDAVKRRAAATLGVAAGESFPETPEGLAMAKQWWASHGAEVTAIQTPKIEGLLTEQKAGLEGMIANSQPRPEKRSERLLWWLLSPPWNKPVIGSRRHEIPWQ